MKFDRLFLPSALPLAALLVLGGPGALAQLPQTAPKGLDQARFEKGQGELAAQKYPDAIKSFESISKDFPTSAYIPAATLQAAICYFFTGEYDKGVVTLRVNLKAKNVAPEILEDTYALIPQLLSAKAQKVGPGDPQHKATLEQAIKEFDVFIQKFPASPELEQANLGKARANYGLKKYEESVAALRVNVEKFPASESALDTQYMLALVLATQANETMKAATVAGENKAADAAYEEAEKLLREIVNKRSDLAVMNDAQFQLGEVLSARGGYAEKGDKQDAVFFRALDAYRGTYAKEIVINAQKLRIQSFIEKQRDALVKQDMANYRRYQSLIQREQGKQADLDARPDQTLAAKLKSASVYLNLHKDKERERMDEARVLLRFVEGFTADAEQKKQILYLLTVTYAAQHIADKAEESYAKWTAAYKADVMGENLPLLLGAMYIDPDPKLNNPQKAVDYFKKQKAMFPKSKFTGQAVMQEALAMIQLKQYPAATASIIAFLATNPDKDLAASAEFGLATVYKDTGKSDDSIKTFRAVREKYGGTEEAEQAFFWVGQMLYGKRDLKAAVTETKAFIDKHKDSELVPAAMLTLGQAQKDLGDSDPKMKGAAIATFKELSAKYPKSEPAPFAPFQIAGIYQADQKYAEVKAVMKEFIAAYPTSDRVYGAYDYIAQIQVVEKQMADAVATYEEFASKFSDRPQASTAILKVSDLWKKTAEGMGRFISVPEGQRAEWKKNYENSVNAAEKLLEKYPESAEVALALQNLLAAQKQFVLAKMKADSNVETYFNELARKFAGKPTTESKIKFTLAGYFAEKDKEKTLKMMREAYDPKLVYAPADLDLYATTLLDQKRYDDVQAVADKLVKDYPLPPNSEPAKLPQSVTAPHALALFLSAKVLQLTGKTAPAAEKFEELKKTYPWSPKLLEADLGIATDLYQQKKYDEAVKLLGPVARATTGPVIIRAKAMMLLGQISEMQGNIDAAINNYIKIATFFEGLPDMASDGLWRGAQLQEKKADGVVKQLPQATPAPSTPAAAASPAPAAKPADAPKPAK